MPGVADAPPSDPASPSAHDVAAAISETSLDGYVVVDDDNRVTYANPAAARHLGCTVADLIGTSSLDVVHPADRAIAIEAVAQFFEGSGALPGAVPGAAVPLPLRLVRRDGAPLALTLTALDERDHPVIAGTVIRMAPLGSFVNPQTQEGIDAALAAMARDADLAEILDLLVGAIDGLTDDGRAVLVVDEQPSRAQWAIPEDLVPELRELPGPIDEGAAAHPAWRALDTGEVVVCTTAEMPGPLREAAEREGFATCWAFPHVTRTFRAVAIVWRPIPRPPLLSSREAIERILDIVGLAIERHRARLALEHAANHDPLTGLSNRSAFETRLDREAARTGSAARQLGVLYLDLDGFKPINDEHGHRAGDSVLREAAARIVGAVRDTDSVARVGGDEFAVLCPDIESPDVLPLVADRIIRDFEEPFALDRTTVTVGISIGIAVTTMDGVNELDVDELLAQADAALYEAKRGGRGRWSMDLPAG